MSKKSPSAPAPPDPGATAVAQSAANRETAISQALLNQINQVTPFGNLEFTQRGVGPEGTPQFTATQTLAPEQQTLLDLTNQAATTFGETANTQLGSLAETLETPFSLEGLGAAPTIDEGSRGLELEKILARARPDIDRDRAALETRLANQGIGIQSEAFGEAFNQFDRGINDFRLAADVQAGNEVSRQFALEQAARDAAINEQALGRSVPLNELAALLGGSQVQQPSFINPPQTSVQPTDVLGAEFGAFNAAQNNFAIEQASRNAFQGGLFGLGGSALLAAGGTRGFLPGR